MSRRFLLVICTVFIIFPTLIYAAVADYLILQDIGAYKIDKPEGVFPGEPPIGGPRTYNKAGIIAATGHFPDHPDKTYEVMYIGGGGLPSPTVQVTQHTGSDSDKWLLHEVEDGYRDNDDSDGRLGLLSGAGVKIREIGGNKFIYWGLGGGSYTWISGQKVIEIKYTDLQRTKPEPVEVIQAYLQKHTSTIPSTLVLDKAHDEKWIKDEMERRLWLCDKWFLQLQLQKAEQKTVLQESVKHMEVFLNYRQKYYGIDATEDKKALSNYLLQNNGTAIRNKLKEYKDWWTANKDKAISI